MTPFILYEASTCLPTNHLSASSTFWGVKVFGRWSRLIRLTMSWLLALSSPSNLRTAFTTAHVTDDLMLTSMLGHEVTGSVFGGVQLAGGVVGWLFGFEVDEIASLALLIISLIILVASSPPSHPRFAVSSILLLLLLASLAHLWRKAAPLWLRLVAGLRFVFIVSWLIT